MPGQGASVGVDRQLVRAWMREGREGWEPHRWNKRSGTHRANTPEVWGSVQIQNTYHLYTYIGPVQVVPVVLYGYTLG